MKIINKIRALLKQIVKMKYTELYNADLRHILILEHENYQMRYPDISVRTLQISLKKIICGEIKS